MIHSVLSVRLQTPPRVFLAYPDLFLQPKFSECGTSGGENKNLKFPYQKRNLKKVVEWLRNCSQANGWWVLFIFFPPPLFDLHFLFLLLVSFHVFLYSRFSPFFSTSLFPLILYFPPLPPTHLYPYSFPLSHSPPPSTSTTALALPLLFSSIVIKTTY